MEGLGQGVRLDWADVAAPVRAAIAELAGGEVVGARTCAGGFSPGAAVRLDLAGGGTAFAKAVSAAQNPRTPTLYRTEAVVNGWLPAHPAIPRLLGTYDEGDWVALVFEHVPALPPALPWSGRDLGAVLAALRSVQEAAGSVADVASSVVAAHAEDFTGWRRLAAAPPDGLDPWSAAHLDACATLEAGWAEAAAGTALLHCDVRADNVLVAGDRAWLIDWPWACAGAAWVDGVFMAPSVALQHGPAPEELMAAAYPDAPADGVRAVVAALAGFWTWAALQPPPPGLPTVRSFQAACGGAARAWLARLLGE